MPEFFMRVTKTKNTSPYVAGLVFALGIVTLLQLDTRT